MIKKPQDTPLIAREVKRVRQYVYDIALYHPSRRRYGVERFYAHSMKQARERCLRVYPTTVFMPRGADFFHFAKTLGE